LDLKDAPPPGRATVAQNAARIDQGDDSGGAESMCFDHDSRPPIAPMAGAAVDGREVELTASDGNRFAAYSADAVSPTGAGIVILPDVRGLHEYYRELALRFAEAGVDAIALDYFGRTAGIGPRGDDFEYMPHVHQTTWAGISADAIAAATALREERPISTLFTVGFCFGGRMSFDMATVPDIAADGVIGFYGIPVGSGRNDAPAPADVAWQMQCRVLGLFGGDDGAIPAESIAAFDKALSAAGVEHHIVAYPGAPHSFFDRKQAEFADASAAAWQEILTFIRTNTPEA
jgi:carboxymethylenebutenolidase